MPGGEHLAGDAHLTPHADFVLEAPANLSARDGVVRVLAAHRHHIEVPIVRR
jgi:hypothetical protein